MCYTNAMWIVGLLFILLLAGCFFPPLLVLILCGLGILLALLLIGVVFGAIQGLWQGLTARKEPSP